MRREDFVFTIGYDGDTAIIDGKARKKYRKYNVTELAEVGMYRAAFCAALFDGDRDVMQKVLAAYNKGEGTKYNSTDDLKRMFGVYDVRNDITKVKTL